MADQNDPRVYFAAERTLLAWVRSGIAVIGLGFLVARFRLFLSFEGREQSPERALFATAIGVVLVILGVVMASLAAVQFRRFMRTLRANDLPLQYSSMPAMLSAWLLAACGVLLAIYLLTSPT
jgi:putative membrane protein